MAVYQWSDEYSVGDPAMDAHHKRLFELIDELHEAVDAGRGEQALGQIIDALSAYTRYHFEEEERMMERVGYPTLDAHRQLHREFVQQIQACEADLQRGATRVATLKLLNTASKWLRDHIMNVDQGYSVLLEQERRP